MHQYDSIILLKRLNIRNIFLKLRIDSIRIRQVFIFRISHKNKTLPYIINAFYCVRRNRVFYLVSILVQQRFKV
jgi:hypothetical protein